MVFNTLFLSHIHTMRGYSASRCDIPKDCKELYYSGVTCSGVYTIKPDNLPAFDVYCDMETDGGGWTVFQRRMDGTEDFYRGWNEYTTGFGNLDEEFWLGLNALNRLTSNRDYPVELRIDLSDFRGESRYAKYYDFRVGNAYTKYRMDIDTSIYCGDAGNSFQYHSGLPFTTWDYDNDALQRGNCAKNLKGGWWYNQCVASNLNGLYLVGQLENSQYASGVVWGDWKGYYYSLGVTEMKLR